jgi:nucleoside-diphosphate-sugar epimerase
MNIDLGCDTSHAKEKLGYHPRITLREGIKKTVQWCKEEGLLHNSL